MSVAGTRLTLPHAGLVSGDISAPRPTSPWRGDQAVPTVRQSEPLPREDSHPCCGSRRRFPERYTAATPDELAARIAAAKAALGDRLFILGHHYQRDEVMRWADARGDSFRLSVLAQEQPEADYIVFCGVHFMAESADILTADHQQVILPDLNAGCSMADMADLDEVEEAWDGARRRRSTSTRVVPITYMNSSAALKAFVGRHGGAVCTSTNARAVLEWAFRPRPRAAPATRCCSSPTSTSAATPASPWATRSTTCGCGTRATSSAASPRPTCKDATFLLWKGHCSVHQRFRPEHVAAFRAEHPDGIVVVHPECAHDVVRGWPTRSARPTTSSRPSRPRPRAR